jgi:hypothetical protein
MAVIWFTLTRLIVTPLNRLTTHVLAVGKTGDLTRRIALDRDDEIGVLSKEFDEATAQLDNARRRLLEQSYQSGMSEIAAGVIHNIRNALSPTVTIGHLSEKGASRGSSIGRCAGRSQVHAAGYGRCCSNGRAAVRRWRGAATTSPPRSGQSRNRTGISSKYCRITPPSAWEPGSSSR